MHETHSRASNSCGQSAKADISRRGRTEEDVITWMMELASENESPAENLAQRYIYTIISSMHTVTAAVVDTVYDLCARPEYIEPLREEIAQVLLEDSEWLGQRNNE